MPPFTDRDRAALRELHHDVRALRSELLAAELRHAARIAAVKERHRISARNLVHYVELRRHDIRELQGRLTRFGLTSLGRTESQVLPGIDALLATLTALVEHANGESPNGAGMTEASADARPVPESQLNGSALLASNTEHLLGPRPQERRARIMVTMPTEAADDAALVERMVRAGMDVARINCAHDSPVRWQAMIRNIRQAAAVNETTCLVAMDLGGPKLRTGPIASAPGVVRVRPRRDAYGRVLHPGLLRIDEPREDGGPVAAPEVLATAGAIGDHGIARVVVRPRGWASARTVGERITITDARGSRRRLRVIEVDEQGCTVAVRRTAYLVEGTVLVEGTGSDEARTVTVGALPPRDQFHLVRPGDTIVLTRDLTPAPVSAPDAGRTDAAPVTHRIGCTLPEVFDDTAVGARVWFDDGLIGGTVTARDADSLTVLIAHAAPTGTKLRAEKGINLPDTELQLDAITEQDLIDLEFVIREADMVDLSFVRRIADVRALRTRLDEADAHHLDIVLKIETLSGFEALPQLLLEAMRWEDVGVMIARGDLAVEVGFERLAEVQEEMLWLCEAAHVPVIWATEVLDTMARTGVPSRAEVTDAAMAQRAECVMLNKGPYIVDAIETLDGILGRMQEHTSKKRSLLRRLRAWDLDHDAR